MFVHSKKLLAWIRLNMNWPEKGYYLPHGLWPDAAHERDRASARHVLDIHNEARVLLIFGLQAIRRKEIDTLADALRTKTIEKPLVLLFAGSKVRDEPHPFDEPDLVAKQNLIIRHHESFIPDDQVKTFFAAADAVWAYYGNFIGASGVFSQAIAYGRMSICANGGEAGELSRKYQVGLLPPRDDLAGVAEVLDRFLSMTQADQEAMEEACRKAAREMAWPRITHQILDIMLSPR
jgi:glycosyltransferase involved in cell wall biosynthesis